MDNPKELIGVLQAISIVAKNLAEKLIRIERDVKEFESSQLGKRASEYRKKG